MARKKNQLKWYSFRWRTLVLIFAMVLCFGGYVAYRGNLMTRLLPVGTGPANVAVEDKPFGKIWSDEKVMLLGLGDSITQGFGAPAGLRYFDMLERNDDNWYPQMKGLDLASVLSNLKAGNMAVDFTVSQEHIKVAQSLKTFPKDVTGIVVITTGGNDLIHDYGRTAPRDGAMYGCTYEQGAQWIGNLKQRIAQTIEAVTGKFPGGCEIFLANIYDPTDGVSDPERAGLPPWPDGVKVLTLANNAIAELCEKYDNVHLVDIHSEFLGHGIHGTESWRKYYHKDDPYFWYDLNLEDPNPRGYDAIRKLFLKEIAKVMPERLAVVKETPGQQLVVKRKKLSE